MTLTLTLPVLLTMLGMIGGCLLVVLALGRWAGEIQAMMRSHEHHVISLRQDRHQHAGRLGILEARTQQIDDEVDELKELVYARRKDDQDSQLR